MAREAHPLAGAGGSHDPAGAYNRAFELEARLTAADERCPIFRLPRCMMHDSFARSPLRRKSQPRKVTTMDRSCSFRSRGRAAVAGLVLACVACGPFESVAAGATATKVQTIEGITEYRLDNGLMVLLYPDPSKPTVTVNMTVLVGSRHEGYGETGMAHLLEHMLFKGTPSHPRFPRHYKIERGATSTARLRSIARITTRRCRPARRISNSPSISKPIA